MEQLSVQMAFEAGVDISPSPDYALIAQGCEAWGRIVKDPEEVLPALKEAQEQVESGKPAIVAVRLGRD